MSLKQCTFLVNGEKIRINEKEVTGPEHLMKTIRAEHERLQGNPVTIDDHYMDLPPGPYLWDARSLFPLLKYIFGKENVQYDLSEPIVHYHPLDPDVVY
jgi:hypothetical protein